MKIYIHNIFTKYHVLITIIITFLVVIIICYGEYRRFELKKQIVFQSESLASTTIIFEGKIKGLDDKIANIVAQNNLLNNVVQTELVKNEALADQVEQVSDTADALDKLSKVDPQLLQKYSKVYFLNEHYTPAGLETVPAKYGYETNKKYQVYDKIDPYLEKMLRKAESDNVDLKIISAYRSFGEQAILKSSYQIVYGAGTANQFSADQGYSEHQLGTTIDITTAVTKENFDLLDQTPAFVWLKANAYKYGFILSYPKSNIYYTYEPWHWRFVGVDLANRLHREGENFYDLDQRVINNYLGLFFD